MVGLQHIVSTNQLKHIHVRTSAMKGTNEIEGFCIFQPEFGEPVILSRCVWLDDNVIHGYLVGQAGTKMYDKQYLKAKATSIITARTYIERHTHLCL